jgi:hypothetical protein
VEVEMFRVLILAEVGQDARAAALSHDLRRTPFDDVKKLDQQSIVVSAARQKNVRQKNR